MNERQEEHLRFIEEQRKARKQAKQGATQGAPADPHLQHIQNVQAQQKSARKGVEEPSMIASMFSNIAAIPNTAVNVAAQLPATVAGGLTGLATAPFVGTQEAVKKMDTVREAMTPTPNPVSAKQMEAIGGLLEKPMAAYEGMKESMGDYALDKTGSPAVATAFFVAPDAAIELLSAGFGGNLMRTAKATKNATVNKATNDLLDPVERLESPEAATHTVNVKGEVVPDRLGQMLVNDGIQAADAALVTNSNLATRMQMARMKKARKDYQANRTSGDSSYQVVGQETARVAAKLNQRRKALGTQLDNVVNTKGMGNVEIDASGPLSEFTQNFQSMGIKRKPDFNTGRETLDFDGSDLDFSTLGNARTVLDDAYKMIQQGGTHSLADLHKLKRGLNQLLDSGKLEAGGSLGDVERIVAQLNSGLNEVMNTVPQYRNVNAQLSSTYDALGYFNPYREAGVGWDSPKVANGIAGRLSGPLDSSTEVLNLREGLKRASKQFPEGQRLSVDVDSLIRFQNSMDEMFVVTEQSVLDAIENIQRSQRAAVGSAAASGSIGNTFGLVHDTAKLVANGAKKSEAKAALDRLRRVENTVDAALARTTVKTQ